MAIIVVMAALVGAGVWGAVLLEGHLATPVSGHAAATAPRSSGPVPAPQTARPRPDPSVA